MTASAHAARRRTMLAGSLLAFGLAGSAQAATTTPGLSCGPPVGRVVTCTAAAAGEYQFTVPAGVRALHADLVGARGGVGGGLRGGEDENGEAIDIPVVSRGGLGTRARADLNVGGGQRVFVLVGGRGVDGGYDPEAFETGFGGFNGGGNGGGQGPDRRVVGGGGGGATDLRFVSDGLNNRVLVAGGGGGGGSGSVVETDGGDHDKPGQVGDCGGGSGHSPRGGIAAFPGQPGVRGTGGDGGSTGEDTLYAGGGGGGGYGGGGGGGAGEVALTQFADQLGCGGGGGSGFFNYKRNAVRASKSSSVTTTAPSSATISYTLPVATSRRPAARG